MHYELQLRQPSIEQRCRVDAMKPPTFFKSRLVQAEKEQLSQLTPIASGKYPTDTDEAIIDGIKSDLDHAPVFSSPESCPSRTTQVSKLAFRADRKSFVRVFKYSAKVT